MAAGLAFGSVYDMNSAAAAAVATCCTIQECYMPLPNLNMLVCCSVISHDEVFEYLQPESRANIPSADSEEENIYDCPPPARGPPYILVSFAALWLC